MYYTAKKHEYWGFFSRKYSTFSIIDALDIEAINFAYSLPLSCNAPYCITLYIILFKYNNILLYFVPFLFL